MTPTEKSFFITQQNIMPQRTPRLGGSSPLGATSPVRFTDTAGNEITTIECNTTPYSFVVDGYSRVWVTSTKNGVKVYDDFLDVPMTPRVADCAVDVGSYVVQAYDPTSGGLIGQASFSITQGGTTGLSSTAMWGIAGIAAAFLLFRRKK